jgi:hypothetical protein
MSGIKTRDNEYIKMKPKVMFMKVLSDTTTAAADDDVCEQFHTVF